MAQVTVTLQVDVTDYAAGTAIDASGMRVGGAFADLTASSGGGTMVNWTPTDAASAMTDLGSNLWEIAVTFPSEFEGDTLTYKFVNGDWGGDEGTSSSNHTIDVDSCGIGDGFGGANRFLVVPSSDLTYTYCYNSCFQCDGTDPVSNVQEFKADVSELEVYPNPTFSNSQVTYTLAQTNRVNVRLLDILGKEVSSVFQGTQPHGAQILDLDLSEFEAGIYFLQVSVGETTTVTKVIKR